MKRLEDLLDFYCDEEDLDEYRNSDDRLKEVFRILCILLNQWGYKPRILECEQRMMRVIVGKELRSAKVVNTGRQVCNTINTIFRWIPYQTTARFTNELYQKYHFVLEVPKDL